MVCDIRELIQKTETDSHTEEMYDWEWRWGINQDLGFADTSYYI